MKILLVDDLPKSLHLRGLRVQMSTKELPKKVWGSFSHHSSKLEPQMSHSRRSRRSNCKRFTQCNITQQCDTQWHFFFCVKKQCWAKDFRPSKTTWQTVLIPFCEVQEQAKPGTLWGQESEEWLSPTVREALKDIGSVSWVVGTVYWVLYLIIWNF